MYVWVCIKQMKKKKIVNRIVWVWDCKPFECNVMKPPFDYFSFASSL